jgi:hypothetical protein
MNYFHPSLIPSAVILFCSNKLERQIAKGYSVPHLGPASRRLNCTVGLHKGVLVPTAFQPPWIRENGVASAKPCSIRANVALNSV